MRERRPLLPEEIAGRARRAQFGGQGRGGRGPTRPVTDTEPEVQPPGIQVFEQATEPAAAVRGDFWYDTDETA